LACENETQNEKISNISNTACLTEINFVISYQLSAISYQL
jgi:hypothetical protein